MTSGPNPVYPSEAAPEANVRRRQIVFGLSLAGGQATGLQTQLTSVRTKALACRETLSDVKEAAADLSTPDAGDTAISALTDLIDALDAALLAVRDIPSLNYEDYQ